MIDPPDLFAIECSYDNGAAEVFLVESRHLDLMQFGWMFAAEDNRLRDITIRTARAGDRGRAANRADRALRSVA